MGGKLVELKNNAKLNNWYMDIQSQKQSGLTVDEWCEEAGMTRSTYYYRYKIVMKALENRLAAETGKTVQFEALPAPVNESKEESIRIRLGDLEVEIPSGASSENIQAVIEALKC
ncbi:MAG: IS66 family insertion sequence element accessory protein TnpA [Saccharofermentanales bacterium]|jgi:hypothetical protein